MAGRSSKELVRDLFQLRELERVPFIPWVCSFAAQLEQIPVEAMLSDAGLLSRSLLNAQALFRYDAIANVFDPSLEAEACGCAIDWSQGGGLPRVASHPLSEGAGIEDIDISTLENQGRLPAILEATKRLVVVKGEELAVAGVITGPLTLARHLRGEAFAADLAQGAEDAAKVVTLAGDIALRLCRRYCELGVDLVVVAEEMLGQIQPGRYQAVAASLRSIWNVAKFYDVHSLLLTRGCAEEHIEPAFELKADGVVLSGHTDCRQVRDAAQKRRCCYAGCMPSSTLLGTPAEVRDAAVASLSERGRGFFLSTEWEIPCAASVNNMHELTRVIQDNRYS